MKHYIFFVLLTFSFFSCKKKDIGTSIENTTGPKSDLNLILTHTKSNISVDFREEPSESKLISILGKPVKTEKEKSPDPDGAEPWTTLKYDGLEITLEGKFISEIILSNRNWKIAGFAVGDPQQKIEASLMKLQRKWNDYSLYRFPPSDGVLFCKFNSKHEVVELGFSDPNN